MSAGFDAGGEWSIQFPDQHDCIKCYAVVSGECWLSVEGVPDAVRLSTGDCFLLPSGRPFRLASDMSLTPVDAVTIFSAARDGGVASYNGGGDFFLVGSRFALGGNHAGILLGMLPPIVRIRKESDQAALRWSVERMMPIDILPCRESTLKTRARAVGSFAHTILTEGVVVYERP